MDLTPELLRTVDFADAKKKGYDPDEVDEFLDRAAADLARQHAQRKEVEARAASAEKRASEIEASSRDRTDSDETLRRTLILAQRTADAAIKEAQDEGARILAEARQKADGLIASAEEQVRREVGATRDRLQAEIRDLEARRGQLHDRITDLSAHLDSERDRLRDQLDQLRSSLEDDSMRVGPIPGADDPYTPLPSAEANDDDAPSDSSPIDSSPIGDAPVDTAGSEERDRDDASSDDDLSDLPPPPIDWAPGGSGETEPATSSPSSSAPLFEPRPDDGSDLSTGGQLDLSDGGPPTQATPVVPGGRTTGAAHIDELRRAVSDRPGAGPEDDDAAMAAFFDQDGEDDDEPSRRFGRRR